MIEAMKDWWYKFSCKYWKKYNQITCSILPPTYVDPCELIRHANFQIPFKHPIKFTHTDEERRSDENNYIRDMETQSETFRQLIAIYNWYWDVYAPFCSDEDAFFKKVGLDWADIHGEGCPEQEKNVLALCDLCHSHFATRAELEDAINEECLSRLQELIKLSSHMWT